MLNAFHFQFRAMEAKRIILVDLDGTVADIDDALSYYDSSILIRTEFEYDEKIESRLRNAMEQRGFYRNLKLMPYAIQAIKILQEANHVVFCTSPLRDSAYCETEKRKWVEEHFGKEMARQMVMTKDKTMVRGDLLIDDKPEQTGAYKPLWRHVLYAQTYNASVPNKARMTWQSYLEQGDKVFSM